MVIPKRKYLLLLLVLLSTTSAYGGNPCEYNGGRHADGYTYPAGDRPKTTSHSVCKREGGQGVKYCFIKCNNGAWNFFQATVCENDYNLVDGKCIKVTPEEKACKAQSNDTEWKNNACICKNSGLKWDGSKCVPNIKVGDKCKKEDLPQFATSGKYINLGGELKCAATACKSGTYLVLNAKRQSMGWCVAVNYCKSTKDLSNHTLNIIDGNKTDLQCIENERSVTDKPTSLTISGTVRDKDTNETLIGAHIYSEEQSGGIITDSDGNFKGQLSAPGDTKLIVSYVGCTPKTFLAEELNDKTVYLDCEPEELDAAFVVACGAKKEDGILAQQDIDGKCYPSKCVDGWTLIGEGINAKCVSNDASENKTETTPTDEQDDTIETVEPSIDNNSNIEEEEQPQPDQEEQERKKKIIEEEEQPQSDQEEQERKKKIDEARKKYEDAKATEQSLENRMLGAASMGAMGIGGMMVASSLAEQNANADAERDMAAYLATFKCDYGAGMNIRGGETGIELPGATELIPLYAEYVSLANDLKVRKEQLGMKPGIESEPILDSATTGLYDDVSTGITSGAYASLARALQNPDGEDAKKWSEQKDKTAKDLKTGAITAGVGGVVGLIGDASINSDLLNKNKDNKSGEKSE